MKISRHKSLRGIIVILFILTNFIFINSSLLGNLGVFSSEYSPKISADTGFVSPATGETIDRDDKAEFTTPEEAIDQDNTYAYCDIGINTYGDWIRVTVFGFDIPNGATIVGIIVEIDCYSENDINIFDDAIYLVLDGSIVTDCDDKSLGAGIPDSDTDTYVAYGGATDMWGTALDEADIEDSTFGVQFSFGNDHKTQARWVRVDHIQIKIYYTLAGDDESPEWDNLVESADPLELGNTESIWINVTDNADIDSVLLEFDSTNHSMTQGVGDTWKYTTWTPTSVGIKIYVIYMNDTSGNWNNTGTQTLTVQDTTEPSISNIQESADPLELGSTETIQCDVSDESTLYFVRLEFEGANHSMSFVSGTTWEYTSWTPSSIGNYPYVIWANDTEGNIASDDTGDITVEDTTNPVINNVQESADPLELGSTETIECDITDESTMDFVYLEFDSVNHSMSFVSGIKWEYTSWTPTSIGIKDYTIYANDTEGNLASYEGSITVEDTTNPVINNIQESADPLELGATEVIECDITDESDMFFVYLEFDSSNYSMSFKSGITWEYTTWIPTSVGIKSYTIWANDTEGNVNSYEGSITVEDTTNPVINNVQESADPLELGSTETIECDITDESTMDFVYLEFDSVNHSMSFVSGIKWEYTSWTPSSVGLKNYKIYANDTEGNLASYEGSITVEDTTDPVISNVIESADPLQLGSNETITCDISDESALYFIYLDIGTVNYTMTLVSGNTYSNSTWQPESTGLKFYTIWANDTEGNINSYTGNITVNDIDTTPPTWDNLVEITDPLEFGDTIIIRINTTDPSGIDTVFIEFDSSNHSMTQGVGDTWKYTTWQPSSVGIKYYTIYMNDTQNNWNNTEQQNFTVQDTINPIWDTLIESDDPLELGLNETISINAYDIAGINIIYLEFEGLNHSMSFISGNTWSYSNWQPSTIGIKFYIIFIEDNSGLWNETAQYNITVQDTINPQWSNLIESADPLTLGQNETITIDVTDVSGIALVYLEYEGGNHTMQNTVGNTWSHSNWQPAIIGVYNYSIYMQDNNGLWNQTENYNITVSDIGDITPPRWNTLIESSDPVIFGFSVTIYINCIDESGIGQVLIQIDGIDNYMINIAGDKYAYVWIPSYVGIISYIIYISDIYNNINSTESSIEVIKADTTKPSYSNLIQNHNPALILGEPLIIKIEIFDDSGINQVFIEINSTYFWMVFIGEDTWQFIWKPTKIGIYNYTIYMEDNWNNWETISDSFEVIKPTENNVNGTVDINNLNLIRIILIIIVVICVIFLIIKYKSEFKKQKKIGKRYKHYAYTNTENLAIKEARNLRNEGYSVKIKKEIHKYGKDKYIIYRKKKIFSIIKKKLRKFFRS